MEINFFTFMLHEKMLIYHLATCSRKLEDNQYFEISIVAIEIIIVVKSNYQMLNKFPIRYKFQITKNSRVKKKIPRKRKFSREQKPCLTKNPNVTKKVPNYKKKKRSN